MKAIGGGGFFLITVSLYLAMVLTVSPLPPWLQSLRPDWVALVLIYWCLATPERIGIGVAWIVGLLLDALTGTLIGQNALALAVVAFLVARLHQRIRLFPLLQQAPVVLMLLLVYRVLNLWVMGITGHAPLSLSYWTPAVVGMFIWLPLFLLLRWLRRRFIAV